MISLAVAADVYEVESLAYIDTQAWFKASGRSLVKIENTYRDSSFKKVFLMSNVV